MENDRYVERKTGSILGTIALVIAIIALTLSWIAYNRTGQDLEDQIARQIESASQDAGEAAQNATDTVERGVDTGPDGVDDGAR